MNAMTKKNSLMAQLIPVMLCFFAMGFVDFVGTGANFLKDDLHLSDSEANLFPSLVFFWFLIFSVPTGMLMNKIGRKKTVMLSLIVTLVSLIIPCFGSSYGLMLVAFSLLGIGNAIMQTSLNPLVSNLIAPDRLASTLTFGQFVKAIASFVGPLIAAWGVTLVLPGDLGWRIIFPIYGAFCILSIALLGATPITEANPDKASGVVECLKLLANPFILLCFLGIMCHVGIDVGTNTTAPRILVHRIDAINEIKDATYATSIYFAFRTAGCLLGSGILRVMSGRLFFTISVLMMLAGMGCLWAGSSLWPLYVGIALIGFGNSNVFSIIFAQALNHLTTEKNSVSGLMIMGLFGGTIFPLAMGFATDSMNSPVGAVIVMTIGVAYLILLATRLKKA